MFTFPFTFAMCEWALRSTVVEGSENNSGHKTDPNWPNGLKALCCYTLIMDSSPTNTCGQIRGSKRLAGMLSTKKLAGVTPEMNLKNALHAGKWE